MNEEARKTKKVAKKRGKEVILNCFLSLSIGATITTESRTILTMEENIVGGGGGNDDGVKGTQPQIPLISEQQRIYTTHHTLIDLG